MSRIWTSGVEVGALTPQGLEWTSTQFSAIDSTIKRSGDYSLKITLTSGSASYLCETYRSSEGTGNYYYRGYLRVVTLPSAENRIFVSNDNTNPASSPNVYISVDNSGTLRLYDEDGQITGTTTISAGSTWYRIEVHINTTTGAGSHVVEARVDGVNFASSSTRSIAVSNGLYHVHFGGNLNAEAQTTGEWYWDDFAINDTNGSFENSWPGDGKVIHLVPNATGDNSAWTNDYTAIDEEPPNDGTDFIYSNTLDQIEDVNLEATPSELASGDVIKVVAVGVRFAGESSSANASFVLRIKASSGGTVEESSATTPSSTTWYHCAESNPRIHQLVLYDLPGASTTAWTKADLDAAQIGVRISTGNTNDARVTALWLVVEFVAGTPKDAYAPISGRIKRRLDHMLIR